MKFVTQKSDGGIKRPDSLISPLIGVYQGSKPGQYSPIYAVLDQDEKLHRVRGCTDLDNKMRGIKEGDTVLIQFAKHVPTSKGNAMVVMTVKKGVEDDDEQEAEVEAPEVPSAYVSEPPIQYGIIEPQPENRFPSERQSEIIARFFKK